MRQDAFEQDDSGDAVDRITAQWVAQRPDIDVTAKAVTGRLVRLGSVCRERFAEAFEPFGLSGPSYGVLAALRRAGTPFRLTPTELSRTQMMTSGGMTAVIDRLENRGLVERSPNPADRRGNLVGLTAEGRRLIDEAAEAHVVTEHELVAALSDDERSELIVLLRKLLLAVDDV